MRVFTHLVGWLSICTTLVANHSGIFGMLLNSGTSLLLSSDWQNASTRGWVCSPKPCRFDSVYGGGVVWKTVSCKFENEIEVHGD